MQYFINLIIIIGLFICIPIFGIFPINIKLFSIDFEMSGGLIAYDHNNTIIRGSKRFMDVNDFIKKTYELHNNFDINLIRIIFGGQICGQNLYDFDNSRLVFSLKILLYIGLFIGCTFILFDNKLVRIIVIVLMMLLSFIAIFNSYIEQMNLKILNYDIKGFTYIGTSMSNLTFNGHIDNQFMFAEKICYGNPLYDDSNLYMNFSKFDQINPTYFI